MSSKVVFATKTWERDYLKMAQGEFLRKENSCKYPFDDSFLVVNNTDNPAHVKELLSETGRMVFVEDHLKEVLAVFNLNKSSFIEPYTSQNGYVYAVGELTAIWAARNADYLCYIQGDCITYPASDWVTEAIEILENTPEISVVSPYSEVNTWGDTDQYMSDQAWVVRVPEFMGDIYNHSPEYSHDYPSYGGRSFEYIVGQYLIHSGQKRKILKKHYVVHGI